MKTSARWQWCETWLFITDSSSCGIDSIFPQFIVVQSLVSFSISFSKGSLHAEDRHQRVSGIREVNEALGNGKSTCRNGALGSLRCMTISCCSKNTYKPTAEEETVLLTLAQGDGRLNVLGPQNSIWGRPICWKWRILHMCVTASIPIPSRMKTSSLNIEHERCCHGGSVYHSFYNHLPFQPALAWESAVS